MIYDLGIDLTLEIGYWDLMYSFYPFSEAGNV